MFLFTSKEDWRLKYGNVESNAAAIVIVSVVGGIFAIGLLAAIALPAYQDYTNRAKVSETLSEASIIKAEVEHYASEHGKLPSGQSDISIKLPLKAKYSRITIDNKAIISIEFADPKSTSLSGETLLLTPSLSGNALSWDCSGGTLPANYRPSQCREGKLVFQQAKSNTETAIAKDNSFQLRVPSYWSKRTDLGGADALLQYANLRKEQYILVYRNPAQDFPEYTSKDFASFFIENMSAKLLSQSRYQSVDISGFESTQILVDAEVDNIKITYLLTFIHTRDNIYSMIQWTLPSKKNTAWPIFKDVATSFRLR